MPAVNELGLANHYVAYPFIIHKGHVRWKAVGKATEEELITAMRILYELKKESKALKGGATAKGIESGNVASLPPVGGAQEEPLYQQVPKKKKKI